ncbi:HAD family hydrolase [Qipengyuania nanhaisediminis]|uniref:HAD family hydrolase n=1 Tax=Qipengyuania nanhaisediminis TaxID=604088 RepID=UPI0038B24B09
MTDTISPHQLPEALDRAPAGVKVLSLDCFDTLLWRDCHAPADVFASLDQLSSGQRIVAERNARKAAATMHRRCEVNLGEIYTQAMPNAGEAERRAAIAAELAQEARACFAFAPTVALMREAKRRGLEIVIVSDTYLSAAELRALIAGAAGDEVAGLIDRVFASSDAGISKSQGLLAKVAKAMKCGADAILHIGDNRKADHDSARALGIAALHLDQFGKAASQRMRFERACQQLARGAGGAGAGAMPQRAVLACEEPQIGDATRSLGLTALGPVFYGFDQWLRAEAAAIEAARGGRVHWLFMLRDGHLPQLVHEAGGAEQSTARVEISRFVAIAASLTNAHAVKDHLALELGLNPATLARQMLFEEDEIESLLGKPETDEERIAASHALHAELRKGQRQKVIARRARGRAERLIAHVRKAVDPLPGDTLMLVDLGYNGTAQDRVDTLLSQAFDCHVAGRYLLLREMTASGFDKKGLIDARHHDGELLEALCGNVAVIEQLATCALGSVTDFDECGEPLRKPASVKGSQSAVRESVQKGVVRFAEAAHEGAIIRAEPTGGATEDWREAALGALMRFMFLPAPDELAVLKSFEHDVNLGSDRMVALFDPDHAREAMRRRGLFYMKGSDRMFLPAELAGESIDTRLSLLVQKRFGLALSRADGTNERIALPAIFLDSGDGIRSQVHAQPTHEGYYAARLAVPRGTSAVALQVGSVFEWLEIAGVTASSIDPSRGDLGDAAVPTALSPRIDGARIHADSLVECTDPAAFVLVNPPAQTDSGAIQLIEFTFRPLRRRTRHTARGPAMTPQPKDAAA